MSVVDRIHLVSLMTSAVTKEDSYDNEEDTANEYENARERITKEPRREGYE
jgi:hypothetical protein